MIREPPENFTNFKVRYSVEGCCRRYYIIYDTTPVPLERDVIPKNVANNEKIRSLARM